MSVTSGFFNSFNGDRKYTAEQFSALIDNLITDGVFASVGTAFAVSGSGTSITIGIGRAWFNSVWVYNDTLLPMAVLSPEMLNDRIDAVVIEINHTESVRAGSIKMVRGTPANTPQWPTLTNTDTIHQYPLAYIYRTAGAAEITQADITNMVGTTACPFVTGILQTISVDGLLAQWESEFNNWFSELDATLDGDTATALAGKILDLEGQFQSLATERAVYMDLNDSSDDDILDSNGNVIRVATRFPEGGKGEVIINPTNAVEESLEVGDILETARTDLGANWLLCNGAVYDKTNYPALGAVLKDGPGGEYVQENIWTAAESSSACTVLNDIIYVNGHYIVGGYYFEGNNTLLSKARIAYATSPEGPWTTADLWSGYHYSNQYTCVTKIKYLNGYYVAIGVVWNQNSYSFLKLAYTTDLTSSWTVLGNTAISTQADRYGVCKPYDIIYANGYYTIAGQYNGYAMNIWNSTSLNGTWTARNITNSTNNRDGYINSIVYVDGKYVMSAYYSPGNLGYGYAMYIETTNPTIGTVVWIAQASARYFYPINYINGYYVLPVQYTGSEWTNQARQSIMYVSDPDPIPAGYNSWSITQLPDYFMPASAVQYADNLYYLVGRNSNGGSVLLAYSQTLDGPWHIKQIWGFYTTAEGNNAIYQNGYWCVVGSIADVSNTDRKHARLAYTDKSKLVLPSISNSDSTYAYIKASEG